ncbi:MAG: hypothetical protein ABFD94_14605 [Armatimonadia bacterium]
MSDTYKIGTTELTSALTYLTEVQGAVAIPPPTQSDYVIPGKAGVLAAPKQVGPRTVTFQGVIVGDGSTPSARRDDVLAKLKTFGDLVYNNGATFTLTRTIGTTAATATARYLGGLETVGWEAPHIARVSVDIQLMDGFWTQSGNPVL